MSLIKALPQTKLQRTRQTAPQVFEILREHIIAVELAPGDVLSRPLLASHFGVSQTPIRDALQKLGDEGLVDIFAQHATVVSRIDITAAMQVQFLRKSIEIEILKTLCQLPTVAHSKLIQELRNLLKLQAKTIRPFNLPLLAELDQAMHHTMYVAAGVEPLWDLLRQKSGHIDRLRRLNLPKRGKARSVISDHQAILEALEKKNAAAAEKALRLHLTGTLAFVDEIKDAYPEWTTSS